MSKRYLNVAFNVADGTMTERLERIFDKATDWIRYSPTNWLLWTGREPRIWYDRLKPLLRPGQHVFIVEIDITERAGWLPKGVWEWLGQNRTVSAE